MNFRSKLSQSIGLEDILEISFLTQDNNQRKQDLFDLLFDTNDLVAYQAAWVMTHFSLLENTWLYHKQELLINEAMTCKHAGKRRLILFLLYRQPLVQPLRVDFLDFCLASLISTQELPAIRVYSMKLAYELCLPIPELLQEFRTALDMLEEQPLQPSIRSARKTVLNALKKKKSLQTYL